MSRLHIDFAPPRPHLAPWVFVAVVVLLGWAAALFFRHQALSQSLAETRAQIGRINAAAAAARDEVVVAPEPAVAPERATAINAAIRGLNVPWIDLLAALEKARPPSVALLQLEPKANRATLHIVAEGDSAEELLGYAEALTHLPPFRRYTPIRQEEVVAGGRSRLQLSFEVEWTS